MTRYLAALILVLSLAPINASAGSLWRLASPAQFSGELSTIKPPASISTDQVIEISVENLHGLATGDVTTLSFSDTQAFDFVLTGQTSYLNGDKGWQAKLVDGDGFVMTLTYSSETVIASVYGPVGKYQLRAFINPSDSSSFIGWLSAENPDVRYAPIDDGGYIPPQYSTRQSFLLSDQPIKSGESVLGLSGNDVSVTQTFSTEPILIGETVDVSIEVKNNLASDITNEVLTVWFTLDVTDLISSDSNCSVEVLTTTTSDRKLLNCSLTKISAGESVNINYTLRTTAQSYPYIDNAVFVGDWRNSHVRDDGYINVIKDTLIDSDDDGISDFNEDILGTDPANSSSVIADNFVPTVDLMFLYTQRFLDDIGSSSPEIEINAMVQLANEQYANSGADIEFRAVHYEKTDYVVDSILSANYDMRAHIDANLRAIPTLRAATGADITVLVDGLYRADDDFCGAGTTTGIIGGSSFQGELFHPLLNDREIYTSLFMPGKSRLSNFSCSDTTLAHELGHNLGLGHSRKDSSSNSGTFAWSRGHGVDNSFRTIMARGSDFRGSSELPLLSNPVITDCKGLPCGVSRNDLEQGADAVLSINTTRFQIANLRDSVVAQNVAPVVAISGGSRRIDDTDNAEGEKVSFTATATDSDGSIATTQWLVNEAVVATGLSATIALPDGSTLVTFKATDNDGDSATTTVTITISSASASQVSQLERNALIKLYNSTDGANWKNNTGWLGAAGAECDWYGITCSIGTDARYVSAIKLDRNQLSGFIPAEISDLQYLTSLNLALNSLSGVIPAELGNLTRLTYLTLAANSLSGSIPSELGNLINLTDLNLFNNSLGGSIPAELGNLGRLFFLNLSKNLLTGSITPELGNLSRLDTLYASNNSFTGSIPSELGNLRNLRWLQLDENLLSGSIPVELGNLKNLTGLVLDGNSLTGNIPSQIGDMTRLSYLDLANNSLSGVIPNQLGKLANLTQLMLHNNLLSGSIPSGLGNPPKLFNLRLNDNSLTGIIPIELNNLENLRYLYLFNNSLTGPIPEWLSTMSIENLDITNAFAVVSPDYEPTEDWPSPYNGVTPDSSYGLEFNNVGFYNSFDATIYVCLRVFTDGLSSSVNSISQFDMGLEVMSLSEATVQVTKFREFNTIGALNENAQSPDCSGRFETTTGFYTDIIVVGEDILETTWNLIDPGNLILKLDRFKVLTAN